MSELAQPTRAPAPVARVAHGFSAPVAARAASTAEPIAGLVVQPKLRVGAADDPLEVEADDIAHDIVVALSGRASAGLPVDEPPNRPDGGPRLSRARRPTADAAIGAEGGEVDAGIEQAISASHGAALPAAIRRDFEGAFGADFSAVRLHSGGQARQLNDQLCARAFTVGGDIFFRDGVPDTGSRDGQLLLAHELAHTVQQGASARRSPRIQRLPKDDEYKTLTGGDKNRQRVLTLDSLVAAYNTAKGIDAKRDELDKILVECDNYLGLPGHSSRTKGVQTVKKVARIERDAITAYENAQAVTGKAALKLLFEALDGYNKADAETGGADYLFTPIDTAIRDTTVDLRKTPQGKQDLDDLIKEDVARLEALSTDPKTPKTLKKILVEILGNKDAITFGEGGAGATQTPGGPTDYKVTSPTGLAGGTNERLSSLTHEMTHVSIGETFDNTAILLAYSQTYSDADVRKLAAKRVAVVDSLKQAVDDDKTLTPRQKSVFNIQVGYMKQDKMLTYVTNFEKAGKLPATDATKLKALAPTIPFSSVLIEYDTVINQLLLLLHQWEIPRSNSLYKKVEKAADDAYKHRHS